MPLTLEIVEGPDAGRQIEVDGPTVIGRDPTADVVLADDKISRQHARIAPAAGGGLVVEDLRSSNGTFVNRNQVYGIARVDPGDELLVGVTLLELRSSQEIASHTTGVRAVPPALAVPAAQPDYVAPVRAAGTSTTAETGIPELDRLLDARTKAQARIAPLAVFVLVVLVVLIYLATR